MRPPCWTRPLAVARTRCWCAGAVTCWIVRSPWGTCARARPARRGHLIPLFTGQPHGRRRARGRGCHRGDLGEEGVPYLRTISWTTDAFYRETPAKVSLRRQEGCLCVEMEAAALFAVAQFWGVPLANPVCGRWRQRLGVGFAPVEASLGGTWTRAEAVVGGLLLLVGGSMRATRFGVGPDALAGGASGLSAARVGPRCPGVLPGAAGPLA